MVAAVQQEAERLLGVQAARLQGPARFTSAVPARLAGLPNHQQGRSTPGTPPVGLVTQITSAPGQPVRIRGPVGPSLMRADSVVAPHLAAPADLRKIVRPEGELRTVSENRQLLENLLNRLLISTFPMTSFHFSTITH
jgi:hypothetical protein